MHQSTWQVVKYQRIKLCRIGTNRYEGPSISLQRLEKLPPYIMERALHHRLKVFCMFNIRYIWFLRPVVRTLIVQI